MISLIITIALVGLIVWLIITYIPMPAPFRTIIIVIAALFLILWLASLLGLGGSGGVSFPSLRR